MSNDLPRGAEHAIGAGIVAEANLERSLAAERAARRAAEHAEEWAAPLRQAAAAAITSFSLDEVIRESLRAIADNLRVDAAAILIADTDGSRLVARAAVGLTQEVDLGVNIPAGEGFAGRILASGKPVIVDDLDRFPVWSPVLRSSGLKSLMGVPLAVGGDIVGVMHLGSRQPAHFSEDDLELLETLAYPIAAAIERVRLFDAERQLRRAAELTNKRLAALQQITSTLAGASRVTEVCETIVEQAAAAEPDETVEMAIWMLRDGRLLRMAGGPSSALLPEIPLDTDLPAVAHLEGGPPTFVETRDELLARWPSLEWANTHAFAGFPLVMDDQPVGVLAVSYRVDHEFDEGERRYLTTVAEQTSIALERARTAELEAAVAERRNFLAEASLALTNRYASPIQLLETLAQLAVPRLADYCIVVLERNGRFERVARACELEEIRAVAETSLSHPVVAEGPATLLRQAYERNEPLVFGKAGGPPLDPSLFGPGAAALRATSAMFVPLESRGRAVGVMIFAACGHHPAYRDADLEVATELASRAGRVVEDLSQRQRERSLAEALTRATLPPHLPQLEGIQLVARYVPAESGPVGGDWYDAFALPDGQLGLVVGDVAGHGVEAASTMARLRNGLVAFASEGHPPAGAFERMSGLLGTGAEDWSTLDPIASVFFGQLDRETLELRSTCAGHPPWLLIRSGAGTLQDCGGRVLAAGLPTSASESRHHLLAGDTCIFFTDGLVERSDEEISASLDRLQEAGERHADDDLDDFADRVLEATTPPGGRRDDCCLLALRLG